MLGMDFSFFKHISTIQLAIFDGIFLLFQISIQSNKIFVLGVVFISSVKFRLLNYSILTVFFCYSDFRYKVTEYLRSG